MNELTSNWLVTMLDASTKTIFLALIAAAAIYLLRIRNSNLRHRVWAGVLVGMLTLPVVTPFVPALGISLPLHSPDHPTARLDADEILPANPVADDVSVEPTSLRDDEFGRRSGSTAPAEALIAVPVEHSTMTGLHVSAAPEDDVMFAEPSQAHSPPAQPMAGVSVGRWLRSAVTLPSWSRAVLAIWLIGVAVLSLRLLIGLWMTARVIKQSIKIPATDLAAIGVDTHSLHAGGVTTYECSRLRVPVTTGILRTHVLLPPAWIGWSNEKLHSVLAHETAHARRRDTAIAMLAELNRAIYWFHPLAWWLKKTLAELAEAACDDEAIDVGGDRAGYARHLLEVAAEVSSQHGRLMPIGVSMARQSNVETRIDAILDFKRPLAQRLSRRAATAVIAVAIVLIALVAAVKPSARAAEQPAGDERATAASTTDNLANGQVDADKKDPADEQATFTFAGTVVDSSGKPVQGAAVNLTYWRINSPSIKPAPLAITDRQGKYQFTITEADFADSGVDRPWKHARLVATKPGFGFASQYAAMKETSGAIQDQLTAQEKERMLSESAFPSPPLRLPADHPVRGRILDTQGNPVVGATITPINIWAAKKGSLDAWEAAAKEPGASFYSGLTLLSFLINGNFISGPQATVIDEAQTDKKGVFQLDGLGEDRIAEIMISGPGIESGKVYVRSRPGETIRLARSSHGAKLGSYTYYGDSFSHVVGPSHAVVGRVVDSKTGKPVAGILLRARRIASNPIGGSLSAAFIRCTTDEDGRYRLEGLPLGKNELLILPPAGSPYLLGGFGVTTSSDGGEVVHNIKLTRGIMLRGQVTDGDTGEPLRGYVDFYPLTNNPHLKDAPTFRHGETRHIYFCDSEGKFQIPILPGPGIFTFNAESHQKYKHGIGAENIQWPSENIGSVVYSTWPSVMTPDDHHYVTPLEFSPSDQPPPMQIKLGGGQQIAGRVVTAEDKPVSDYYIFGSNDVPTWYKHGQAKFTVKGYYAADGRRVMAYHPQTDAIGEVKLTGPAPESITIQLSPAGRVTGRVVDEDGAPIAGSIVLTAPKHLRTKSDENDRVLISRVDGKSIFTDEDGRFELVGLMPTKSYAALLSTPGMGRTYANVLRGMIFEGVTVNPGETKDLGDLSIKPIRRSAERLTTKQQQDKKKTVPAEKTNQNDAAIVSGLILDVDGKPIADAKILAPSFRRWPPESLDDFRVKELGSTDNSGSFSVSIPEVADAPPRMFDRVYVHKPGYGINWLDKKGEDANNKREVRLIKESPITGRLMNTEGQPLPGAKISVTMIGRPKAGKTIDDLIAAWKKEWSVTMMNHADVAQVQLDLLGTTSDAEGRFTIGGLPAGWITALRVAAPHQAQSTFFVFNKQGLDAEPLNAAMRSPMMPRINRPVIKGPKLTHVCEPEFVVTGRVVDDQNQPLVGVSVQGIAGYATPRTDVTDEKGVYRLDGLQRGGEQLVSFRKGGKGVDFLPRTLGVQSNPATAEKTLDVMLKRGIVVSGSLTDSSTGEPVSGSVRFVPLPANEFSQQAGFDGYKRSRVGHSIQSDGKFRLVVIPGPGVLLVQATGNSPARADRTTYRQVILTEEQNEKIGVTGTGRNRRFTSAGNSLEFLSHANALAYVDYARDSGPHHVDLTVSQGKSVDVKLVDESGQPVRDVFVSGISEDWPLTAQLKEPTCTIKGLGREPRKVLFLQAERGLAGSVTLTGDEQSTVTVKLGPAATIAGVALDPSGEPIAGLKIETNYFNQYASELYRFYEQELASATTDGQGRFQITRVLPGERFNLDADFNGESIRAQAKPELIQQLGFDPAKGVRRLAAPQGGHHDFGQLLFGQPFGQTLPWPKTQ